MNMYMEMRDLLECRWPNRVPKADPFVQEEEPPKERKLFTKQREEKVEPQKDEHDELDIPAFIRNRMKK